MRIFATLDLSQINPLDWAWALFIASSGLALILFFWPATKGRKETARRLAELERRLDRLESPRGTGK